MSNYESDQKLRVYRHLLVPVLWLLLIGLFVFILLNAPGPGAVMAFIVLVGAGVWGTWYLIDS